MTIVQTPRGIHSPTHHSFVNELALPLKCNFSITFPETGSETSYASSARDPYFVEEVGKMTLQIIVKSLCEAQAFKRDLPQDARRWAFEAIL